MTLCLKHIDLARLSRLVRFNAIPLRMSIDLSKPTVRHGQASPPAAGLLGSEIPDVVARVPVPSTSSVPTHRAAGHGTINNKVRWRIGPCAWLEEPTENPNRAGWGVVGSGPGTEEQKP
ncbi:hypothetical protein CDD83_7736 [Cordyceps sp. RAO-2017]|nr:hypothetical protein CDD83_7736 [Cordyceps sp. RAO-2017]